MLFLIELCTSTQQSRTFTAKSRATESGIAEEGPTSETPTPCIRQSIPRLRLHRYLMHELLHQGSEATIRLHQLRFGTHEPIRHVSHAPEERILKDPRRLIHPVCKLGREAKHILLIARDGCNLGDHDVLLRVIRMHGLDVLDRRLGLRTVVVQTQEIRRVIRYPVHEILDPLLACRVTCAAGAD